MTHERQYLARLRAVGRGVLDLGIWLETSAQRAGLQESGWPGHHVGTRANAVRIDEQATVRLKDGTVLETASPMTRSLLAPLEDRGLPFREAFVPTDRKAAG